MSFLYPFTISVRRPAASAAVGDRGYGGAKAATETIVLEGPIPAGIQPAAKGRSPTELPGEPKLNTWMVLVPHTAGIGQDVVKRADIIIDNNGRRLQVEAPIWTSRGFQARCLLLEP